MRTQGRMADQISLELEATDQLRACTIAFKFVAFKTSVHANVLNLPKRIFL